MMKVTSAPLLFFLAHFVDNVLHPVPNNLTLTILKLLPLFPSSWDYSSAPPGLTEAMQFY